jgi:uncharacterized protein YjiS (DUF1127 family)
MAGFAHQLLTNSQASALPARRRRGNHDGPLSRIAATLVLWLRRSRQRAALARLTDRELADFGASRADAYWEISAPFWRASPRR